MTTSQRNAARAMYTMSNIRIEVFDNRFLIFNSELISYIASSHTLKNMALDLCENSAIQQSALNFYD